MEKKLLFLLLLIPLSFIAQNNRVLFYGKVIDSTKSIVNVHIYNISTKQGSFSSETGNFKILAKANDSIQLSSIGYETKKIIIAASFLGMSENVFLLNRKTYELDEVEVRKHNLIGTLTSDILQVPINKKSNALEKTMDFSNVDWNAKVKDDHIDTRVRPKVVRTDPTQAFIGVGTSVSVPFGYSKKLWALRRKVAFKKSFPSKILSELGEDFFFKELKIPVEKYHHFLEYCNPLDIENLYLKGKILRVIKILREQHLSYLKIIQKE